MHDLAAIRSVPSRQHGGDIERAAERFGGARGEWLDLSTGINRRPYPVAAVRPEHWRELPTAAASARLVAAARSAYGTDWPILPLAGAQAAIQLLPRLAEAGRAAILGPTYNEYAAAFRSGGWHVVRATNPLDLSESDVAVVVNPNNPDGRRLPVEGLNELADTVGLLVIDESFADPHPELSAIRGAGRANVLVLRSFGKFYGLAGLRLGFAIGAETLLAGLAGLAGPWPVSGPALAVGTVALADSAWRERMIVQLAQDAVRLDDMAASAGWHLLGGTSLFRLFDVGDAGAVQAMLAGQRIWTRIFDYAPGWLRLGIPGPEPEWRRLRAALG